MILPQQQTPEMRNKPSAPASAAVQLPWHSHVCGAISTPSYRGEDDGFVSRDEICKFANENSTVTSIVLLRDFLRNTITHNFISLERKAIWL